MKDDKDSDLTTFNLAASTLLTLAGILSLAWLIPDQVPVPAGPDQGLSARFMPTVAVSALTVLAFLLGMNVLIRKLRGLAPLAEENEDNDDQGFGAAEAVNTMVLLAGSGVYVGLLATVGFVVSTAFGLAVCLYFGGVRNRLLIVALCLGIPLVLEQILWWGLTIQLPAFQILD